MNDRVGPQLDPAILSYYNRRPEETRLEHGVSQLEAVRVLRPGGILFAAAISRWASTLDGLVYDFFADPAFTGEVEREVSDGQHRNPAERAGFFTTAFFHRPEELRAEVASAGLQSVALYGIQGPARMLADFDERWCDPRRRGDMLRVARLLESEPALLGLSPHLLAVARK